MQQPSPSTVPFGGSQAAPFDALNPRPNAEAFLRIEKVSKTYPGSASRAPLTLFRDLDLTIYKGELVAIVGQSGSGKSTFLHMLGALDSPSSGTIYCGPTQITKLSLRDAARFQQPASWICLAVSLPASRVYGAGKRSNAASGARASTQRSPATGGRLAGRNRSGRPGRSTGPASSAAANNSV